MLSVEASAFTSALARCKRVGRSSYPILSGVRLVAEDGRLACWRSDLTLTIESLVPASKGSLDVVVPFDLLHDYLATADGPVAIAKKDDRLIVEARGSHVALPMMRSEDWPLIEHTEGETVELGEADVAAIRAVAYAAGTDPARATLTGIHFTGERVEATDSYRLGRVPCTVPECLIPAPALVELEPGKMTVTDRSVTFETDAARRTVRTLEGDYPRTDAYFGVDRPEKLTADRQALLDAVKVARLAAPGGTGERIISITPEGDGIVVAGRGEAEAAARVAAECSFSFRFGVNAQFFTEMLGACDDETVELRLFDSLKPMGMVGAHDSEHVLMPVRLI